MKSAKSNALVAITAAGLLASSSAMALSDGDALMFDTGSYFGFQVAPGFWIDTPITSHDGIIIGQEQPASGSHSGPPNGSEEPSIDEPWSFFANTGMHQTVAGSGGIIIIGDDGAGNFDLRFNGFGVAWNSIPHIPLSDGVATLSCSSAACNVGDGYVLDYQSMVPYGSASGFGGVPYRLHLEGYIGVPPVNLNLNVTIDGGDQQECSQHGGSNVHMTATFNIPPGDQLESVTWNTDGIVTGTELNKFFAVGNHTILVTVNTVSGLFDTQAVDLEVRDTTDPVITAEFIGAASGMVITEIDKERKVNVSVSAVDVCDPNPVITHSYLRKNDLVNVQDGDQFLTLPNGTTDIHLLEESVRLDVGARDAYGNVASKSQTLYIR